MPDNGYVEIHDVAALDSFLAQATDGPAILFKHSNSCGISSSAYREMSKLKHPVGMIIVQRARQVSDEIERRFGLSHETPQVLIVRDNKLLWHASHSQVRAHAVEAALEAVSSKR
jgi:bacillithiol system protein YtxJ